jgi:hypothetical protein
LLDEKPDIKTVLRKELHEKNVGQDETQNRCYQINCPHDGSPENKLKTMIPPVGRYIIL